jgi:hypothetical protein
LGTVERGDVRVVEEREDKFEVDPIG